MQYSQVVLVDNGGFFPEQDTHRDVAWFLMDAMKVLGTDATTIGDRDLRFGIAFLRAQVKRTALPVVAANLMDKKTKKPIFEPYVIKKVGNVSVGIFGLLSEKADLGPAKDSLLIVEPAATARQIVAQLRGKGVTTVLLLSQLGKVESEDLVTAVDGIDAVMVGRNVGLLQKGRMVKNTVACYGGDQGQYLCRTTLTLDAKRRTTTGEAEAFMLGPEIGEKPEIQKLVKSFEDGFNERLRKAELEKISKQQGEAVESSADHFVGAEVCARCHADEAEQWKTTSHSVAWQTLIDAKKDATPDCIPCHVVGYNQPGGFKTGAGTPQLANVQCENCHGMGTSHDAFSTAANQVTDKTCITCHQGENDPEFNWDIKLPKIAHSNYTGETIKHKKGKMGASGETPKGNSAH